MGRDNHQNDTTVGKTGHTYNERMHDMKYGIPTSDSEVPVMHGDVRVCISCTL